MKKFIKSNWQIILIVFLGLILRIYHNGELFSYNHDNDLAGWVVKDILVNKHLRLIGQETSTQGIFIGGLFYYLQIPFYLLFRMDPIGATYLGMLLGAFYIVGIYLILKNVFSKNIGLIGSLVYSVFFVFIFNDREIVPTQPVIFWSFVYFWALADIIKGNVKRGLLVNGILFALIWHLNFALLISSPLLLIALWFSRKKFKISYLFLTIAEFSVISIPLIYFEIRHSFVQSKAFIASLTTNQHDIVKGYDKVVQVYHLISKNYYSIFLPSLNFPKYEQLMFLVIILFLYLFFKLKKYRKIFILMLVWFLLYFSFFSAYSKIVSEYYLSGIQFIPVILLSLFIDSLISKKKFASYGLLILVILVFENIYRFFTIPVNRSGYVERKAIVDQINVDAQLHGYPCIAISYITDPGYDLGYRYFFWLDKIHVNKPSSGSPVYTIVFPLNDRLFPADKTFGALGLIYPDYSRYTKDTVAKSCSGENSNLTDPMFGFTN